MLKHRTYKIVSVDQSETHLRCPLDQIIEQSSRFQSRDYIFEEILHISRILVFGLGENDVLEKLQLTHRHYLLVVLDLLQCIVDVQAVEYPFFIQSLNDLSVPLMVGCYQSFWSLFHPVERSFDYLYSVKKRVLGDLQKGDCKGCELVVMGESIESYYVPLLILQRSLLLHQIFPNTKITAFPISLEVLLHTGQDKHKKGRVLLRIDINFILLVRRLVNFEYLSPYLSIMFSEILCYGFDGLMELSETAQHVVEVAIVDVVHRFEVDLELVNGHVFGGILHDLKNFRHVVLALLFLGVVGVVVGVVEVDQLKLFITGIRLQKLHLLPVATLDALSVEVGTVVPLEAVAVQLDGHSVLFTFLSQDISEVDFIGYIFEQLLGLREQELSAIIGWLYILAGLAGRSRSSGGNGAIGLLAFDFRECGMWFGLAHPCTHIPHSHPTFYQKQIWI